MNTRSQELVARLRSPRAPSTPARKRKRARSPRATAPDKRARVAAAAPTCSSCLSAAGASYATCGGAHVLCDACVARWIPTFPLRGPHGLPDDPDAAAWDASPAAWAPFCLFCPSQAQTRLAAMTGDCEARVRAAARAHVADRFARARAAASEQEAAGHLAALLRLGQPVYRCPVAGCGTYAVHTACDDLRSHHLQLLATDELVTYTRVFREKVLDDAAIDRLAELYELCAPGLKNDLPKLLAPSNVDADGKPLRGPPVSSNACVTCGFLGQEITEWHRVCTDCHIADHPVNTRHPYWTTVCKHCDCVLN